MRVLTVRQPWAEAIMLGKDVENRRQLWNYRGTIAILAGAARVDPAAVTDAAYRADLAGTREPSGFTFGAIVGTALLVDSHRWQPGCCRSPWAEHGVGVVHLELSRARRLPHPIPHRGMLGLTRLPDQLEQQIRRQLP